MCDLQTSSSDVISIKNIFFHTWKNYGEKYGLDTENKCVEHAIRESVFLIVNTKGTAVFDWKRYIQDHSDLQKRLGKNGSVTYTDATCHYLNHGLREKRKAYVLGTNEPYTYDFDWKKYDELNPDVFIQRSRGEVIGKWHCFRHWCEFGYKENRKTGNESRLSVKNDASISTDENTNKQWREELLKLIDKSNTCSIDDLIKFEIYGDIEELTGKYNFNIPTRTDNKIRLIYCGALCDEENILEIIEDFQQMHTEQPEVVLKIVYDEIKGDTEFTQKIGEYIETGVDGITFKRELSYKDSCYEIATSNIGICYRKNGGGDSKIIAKVNEYNIYGLIICKTLKNLRIYNIGVIFEKEIHYDNVLFLFNNTDYSFLTIHSYSNSEYISDLSIEVNGKILIESNKLLDKTYITPNFIDSKIINKIKSIYVHGKHLSKIIIYNTQYDIDLHLTHPIITKYLPYKIFSNKIAYVGDEFTFNSLNDILNVSYISKNDVSNINIDTYDFLYCDSTWSGIDDSWKNTISNYSITNSHGIRLLVNKFKKKNKRCIYYNKEDPVHFNLFSKCASLFDVIITTSFECVEKYERLYPNKIIICKPFLCNPVTHNPINNKKEKTVYFLGGFYSHFPDRLKDTYNLFDNIIDNKQNLKIINRHYFFPKKTRQISSMLPFIGRYVMDKKYNSYEVPSVSHEEATNTYKNSLFHLNVNTVTTCNTMCSRRLIELLACGCNVLSNKSNSIDYLKLPVITDVTKIPANVFNNFNLEGFYHTQCNFSYVSLIEEIYTNTNIQLHSNIKFKLICGENAKLPYKYYKYLNVDDHNFEIICNNCDESYIKKLIIYLYFFDGNVAFTRNADEYFTIVYNSYFSDNVIISLVNPNQTLLIPHLDEALANANIPLQNEGEIKQNINIGDGDRPVAECESEQVTPVDKANQQVLDENISAANGNELSGLYNNTFNIQKYYNEISIHETIDDNRILIVMCLWKRINYFKDTLTYIKNQKNCKKITLCIWNNNVEEKDEINKIVQEFDCGEMQVIIHHSLENIGGIGRFVMTKYICEQKHNFENVIFIDDDQIIRDNFVTILLDNKIQGSGFHWYGRKFYNDKLYWDSWLTRRNTERNDYDYTNFNKNLLDYGGTCGMIIDTECFLLDDFYNFNIKYQFVEDLWMSYYVINKLGYKLFNGYEKLRYSIYNMLNVCDDSNAQWRILKPTKDIFLKALITEGNWTLNTNNMDKNVNEGKLWVVPSPRQTLVFRMNSVGDNRINFGDTTAQNAKL